MTARKAKLPMSSRTANRRPLVCLGCGCTDEAACPGGCHWVQPGICSSCEPRTSEILAGSPIADELVNTAFRSLRRRNSGFAIMSLALIAWRRDERARQHHVDHLREGLVLKPFTRVRVGKTCVSFGLVYRPPKGVNGLQWTERWRLGFSTRPRR